MAPPVPSCTPPGPTGHVMAFGTAASPTALLSPGVWFWGAVGLGLQVSCPSGSCGQPSRGWGGQVMEAGDQGLPELCLPAGRRSSGQTQSKRYPPPDPGGRIQRLLDTAYPREPPRTHRLAGDAWCSEQTSWTSHLPAQKPRPLSPATLGRDPLPSLLPTRRAGCFWPASPFTPLLQESRPGPPLSPRGLLAMLNLAALLGRPLSSTHHPYSLQPTLQLFQART